MNPCEPPRFISSKPVRFPKRRSVTIAAGFKCTDGIVLCADTQETVGDYKKRNRAKITVKPGINPIPLVKMPRAKGDPRPPEADPPRLELIAGFAGAGDTEFLEKLIDVVWATMAAAPSSFDERCSALEDGVIGFYQKYWPIYPADIRPSCDLLVGVWSASQFGLLKVIGPLVSHVPNYAAIGCGMAEADALVDRFSSKQLSMKEATSVAIYILKAVKEQVPYCGGDSHILRMTGSGHAFLESGWTVKWAEEKLRRLEEAVAPLILAVGSGEADSAEFQESLDEFGKKLRAIKEELQKVENAFDQAGDYRPWK